MSTDDNTVDCLPLSADLQDIIDAAARPLLAHEIAPFMAAVAEALRGQQPGPGAVYRACREVQRRFFDPPDLTHRGARAGL